LRFLCRTVPRTGRRDQGRDLRARFFNGRRVSGRSQRASCQTRRISRRIFLADQRLMRATFSGRPHLCNKRRCAQTVHPGRCLRAVATLGEGNREVVHHTKEPQVRRRRRRTRLPAAAGRGCPSCHAVLERPLHDGIALASVAADRAFPSPSQHGRRGRVGRGRSRFGRAATRSGCVQTGVARQSAGGFSGVHLARFRQFHKDLSD